MDRRRVLLVVAAVIAALGTLLVFLYVRGADNRADARYNAVKVLRAVKQIAPGETVAAAQSAGKIELGSVTQDQRLPDALSDLNGISGQVALTTIEPGEQIIGSKFGATASGTTLTIPKGKLAVSVNLTDPARVAGFVNPGDNVAVFMQGSGFGNAGSFTRLLLPKVQVIGVGTTTVVSTTTTDSSGAQTTEQLPRTLLTLALDQKQAERVLFASGNGELALGLLNNDSAVTPDRGISGQNLFS
jgi:pilus assembly protein CpaB